MQNFLLQTVLAIACIASAASAHATIIDFEQPVTDATAPSAPLIGNGDSFTQSGFVIEPYSLAKGAQPGDLVGALVDGSDPSSCVSVGCPGNNSTHYFTALNDSVVALYAANGKAFFLQGFDAGFVGSGQDTAPAPYISGYFRMIGYTANYTGSVTSDYFDLEGTTSDGGHNFNSYTISGLFARTQFVEVDIFTYYCPPSGADCTAFNTNKGQLALDNIALMAVPEPADWALMTGGLLLVVGAVRSRRRT